MFKITLLKHIMPIALSVCMTVQSIPATALAAEQTETVVTKAQTAEVETDIENVETSEAVSSAKQDAAEPEQAEQMQEIKDSETEAVISDDQSVHESEEFATERSEIATTGEAASEYSNSSNESSGEKCSTFEEQRKDPETESIPNELLEESSAAMETSEEYEAESSTAEEDLGEHEAESSEDAVCQESYSSETSDVENSSEISEEETSLYVTETLVTFNEKGDGKLTGAAGLKLNSLTCSAQGYREIVLNFTAVPNGSDGTDTEDVYYEVKVTATPKNDEKLPAGSSETPKYYYIKKTENRNTQSKSIQVNDGDLSAPTACTYEFSVRLVHIPKTTAVPDEDTPRQAPLDAALFGNTITKSFATKNLYFEDKLGFTKKNTKIYTGQSDLLVGMVKYSKNASYLHDLTAYAYDSAGAVCYNLVCTFRNDNDELYISADKSTIPGKYTIVVYAGVGESETKSNPYSGAMYLANTSFTLTVVAGINYINTSQIVNQVAVTDKKNGSFSAAPVGYSGFGIAKAKIQKFTYEIKSAEKNGSDYNAIEATDRVKNNISVSKAGKVTIKKGYTVDPVTGVDYIAIVIKAADFEGNDAEATVFINVTNTPLVPTEIYLKNNAGENLGTSFSADKAVYGALTSVWTYVVVLDQFGNDMTQYVTLTPKAGKSSNNKNYTTSTSSGAILYIYKLGSVTVKATSTDGGKKSKSVTFKVTAPGTEQGLYWLDSITYNGSYIYNYKTQTGLVSYAAPRGSVIKIYNGYEINRNTHTDHTSDNKLCRGIYNRSWFELDYEIKGGKLSFDGNLWVITPTQQTATLTTWPKSNPKRRSSVRFTNTGWNQSYDEKPKIRLTEGKLYSSRYSTESEVYYDEYYEWLDVPNQRLSFQYDSGDYDNIMIKAISKGAPYVWISDFSSQNRTFNLNASVMNLKPGSYKYSIAFYKNKNGTTDIAAKSTTITVKVNKSPKIKIASSYTLKTEQADSITLKLTPSDFLPDFDTKILNANIGGKANNFSDYFEMTVSTDPLGVSRASVKFKDTITKEQKAALKGQTLTGYVIYSYYSGYSYVENTAKITVKVK